MATLFGFLIAIVIAVTGAGGGTLTVPVLVLVCGLSPAESVGTAMVFAAAVKLVCTPVYVWRRQFSGAALGRLLAGGLPGVIVGTLVLASLHTPRLQDAMSAVVGGTTAVLGIVSLWRLRRGQRPAARVDRSRWLSWVALPIGVEIGFTSAGASALGCTALLSLTPLAAPVVVGTDLLFGLTVSAAGGGLHLAMGSVNGRVAAELLGGGIAGALAGPWLAACVPVRTARAGLSLALSLSGAQLFWRGVVPLLAS